MRSFHVKFRPHFSKKKKKIGIFIYDFPNDRFRFTNFHKCQEPKEYIRRGLVVHNLFGTRDWSFYKTLMPDDLRWN